MSMKTLLTDDDVIARLVREARNVPLYPPPAHSAQVYRQTSNSRPLTISSATTCRQPLHQAHQAWPPTTVFMASHSHI